MQDIFVGRQPIYNRNLGIYGYELLFRTGQQNRADTRVSGDGATSQVIINTFIDMGIDNLVGSNMASINLTERFLLDAHALPIPASRVILEIHNRIPINDKTMASFVELKNLGFTLALDDIRDTPNLLPLLKLVDIIKLDSKAMSPQQLEQRLKAMKKIGLKVLAEKIESLDEYERYMDMGFDYFQGYFLSQPRIIKSKTLETNKLSVINLLSTLHNAGADVSEIEKVISRDLSISYKLLKLINSAFFNLPNKVESIRHAIVFLGRRKLSSWASMLAMSSMDDRPVELVQISMVRGKICELIAEKIGRVPEDSYFTVGMFSALDLLMERPIASLLEPLPLADDIKQAILQHQGPMGAVLACARAMETGNGEQVQFAGLETEDLSAINLQAIAWANEVTQSLQS
ncbi:MAG: HDOD domain-containing protein [Gammaproteobacteria bacterium]|nr:MAG: HDOD domain-containing protein [Gammaproteobacteria bacterium]